MTLEKFILKHRLPSDLKISFIPIKHPKTGRKIYIISSWFSGFMYRHKPGKGTENGQIWPCQYYEGIENLEVPGDALKELRQNYKK